MILVAERCQPATSVLYPVLNEQSVSFSQSSLIRLALARDMEYAGWPDLGAMLSFGTEGRGWGGVGWGMLFALLQAPKLHGLIMGN